MSIFTQGSEYHHRDANPPTSPLLVDRHEAARLMGVSAGTIDNLRTRGELASVKLMSRRLFDVADLRRLIEARKVEGEKS